MGKNSHLGGNPKTTICYFHSTGGCSKPTCKFQHPLPPLDDEGQVIICRYDKIGKTCRKVCGFRHPSREAKKEPEDLRDVLTPRVLMLNRRVQLTDPPVIQNNQKSSPPEATPAASTSSVTATPPRSKVNLKQNPISVWNTSPTTSARSAVKRKSSSSGDQSPGARAKRFIPHTESEATYEENGYYIVSLSGDKSENLKICDQDLVKFKKFGTSWQGSRLALVLNELDETVVIPSSSLERQIVLSSGTRSCPFTSCKAVRFNSEKPYMEHLILEHFYQKFSNFLKSSYSMAQKRFRCPQQNCSESFSDIRDLCLHYGGFPHAKVIGLLFNSIDISVSQNGKENKCELSDLKKKITEKEEELARLKSSHMNHLTVKDEEIEDQKKKVENLTSKLQEKEAKLKSQDAQIKDHERSLKEIGQKVKVQESKLTEVVVKLNNQATKLKNQATNLKNQETKIRDQNAKLEEGEAKMTEKLIVIEQLQNELKEKNIALKKVEESKSESEKNINESLDKLKKENELLKKNVREMEALNLSVKNVMHKTNLDNNLKSVQVKKEFQQKEKELEKKIKALLTEKKELENILTQSRERQGKTHRDYLQLREEFESQSADLSNFKSDIEASHKEKEELLGSLSARFTEAAKLEREKEELRESLRKMEEERDSMDEDNTKLSREIKLLERQLTDVNRNKTQEKEVQTTAIGEVVSQQRLLEVNNELETVKRERDELKFTEAAKLEIEKEELQESLRKMEEERDGMDKDNTKLRREIKLLKRQLTDVNRNKTQEKEVQTTAVGEVVSQQRLLEVSNELEAVKRERDEMRNFIREKDETIKQMENKILPFVRTWYKELN